MRGARPLLLAVLLLTATAPAFALDVWVSRSLDLGADAHGLRVDAQRRRAYVSTPGGNRIVFVDLETFAVQRRVYVGFHPMGLDLSSDGNTLYSALNGSGSISAYDLDLDTNAEIDISLVLGDSRTWDLKETAPGVVFVSANCGGNGFAWIVKVDVANQTGARVADNRIVRTSPTFAESPSGAVLYVVGDDSPNLSALDLTAVGAPMLYGDYPDGFFWPYSGMAINPDGSKLVFGSGQVARTSDFAELGSVGDGAALFSADGSEIVSAHGALPLTITRFDANTFELLETIPTACNVTSPGGGNQPAAIQPLATGKGWVIASDQLLCKVELLPDQVFANGFDVEPHPGRIAR